MGGTRRIACAALAAALLAVAGGAGAAGAQADDAPACAAATQSTISSAYLQVTHDIYDEERSSVEVSDDLAHVTGARDLATAVANDDAAATLAATTALVYHPAWHIVRLRVISSTGRVLADVGGPYILAPVRGRISYQGRFVGSFVMSVQDDLGYEKLVTRFTGLPIELYRRGRPLMGRDFPARDAPARDPANGTRITVAGVASVSASYDVLAFPTGRTRVLLAIPAATAALRADSCAVVNALTDGLISADIARLFKLPGAAQSYVNLVHEVDARMLTIVRRGASVLASSNQLDGPATIPSSGTVGYLGEQWFVYSFVPVPGVSVYLLFPLEPEQSGASGQSGAT
ncbi:MAG TPA: hypothetical protein VL977_03440 [Solirubrobacteraceae bacterium]|nr:hypothetical protein [Solirubrobacteraceae bacterium]